MYPPTVGKVFSRLGSEFYVEKVGDRTVLVDNAVGADQNKALHDLDNKLREGIILSFRQRTALYDLEIRRLDASRGTAHFDFRQLFLVKER